MDRTFPHRITGRLTASDLMEVTQYCHNHQQTFRLDGRVDARKARPVKLWFTNLETAQHFSQKFSQKA